MSDRDGIAALMGFIARLHKPRVPDDQVITVCDACFRACCWHGMFMCDDAYRAGTVDKTVGELRALDAGEHEDYWREPYV